MSDESESGKFELEPEDDRPPPKPAIPAGREPPKSVVSPAEAPVAPYSVAPYSDEPDGPDEQTLAERKGTAVPTTPDALPPPANWPREMFSFPLRKPGPSFFVGVGGALVLADLLLLVPAVAFVAYVLLFLFWLCALRAQVAIIGQCAAGKDSPVGWHKAMELDFSDLSLLARYLLFYFGAFILPQWLALAFGMHGLTPVAILLSPYLAVVTLGLATGDRSLKWPWKALPWLARRPLAFAVGAAGWWALWYGSVLIHATPFPALVVVSPLIRFASLYLLLVSARAIGVAGRSWTPWGYQDPQ